MRKGITPIIAIVILLLIAVAIAGAAYTYITGYWTGLTGKTLELTSTTCNSDGIVTMNVRNFGQAPIDMANDVSVTKNCIAGTCGTTTIQKSGTLDPGQGTTIKDGTTATNGCWNTGTAGGATCEYTITTAGRAQTVTVTCT